MFTPRIIKYKAIWKNGGGWVFGCYAFSVLNNRRVHLITHASGDTWEIEPSTVCEFTSLCDKNGNDLYEFDIVKHADGLLYLIRFEFGKFSAFQWYGGENRLSFELGDISEYVERVGTYFDQEFQEELQGD